MQQILEGYGIEVDIAENGQQALEKGLSSSYGMILMDMQMPVMDGIEATALLRQSFCQVPIVALTANVMRVHRDKFSEAGCNEFLTKPIDQQQLEQVLGQYLKPITAEEAAARGVAPHSQEMAVSESLMQTFLEGAQLHHQNLREGMTKQMWEQVRAAAHNIKGCGANFGYPELTEMGRTVCDRIDPLASDEEIMAAAEVLDRALAELQ